MKQIKNKKPNKIINFYQSKRTISLLEINKIIKFLSSIVVLENTLHSNKFMIISV